MLPLVEDAPQGFLVTTAFGVGALEGELIIELHLIPTHLVNHYHGTFWFKCVQLSPQPALFFLYCQGGNFCYPGCKLTYNDGIFVHVLDYIVNPGQAAPEKRAGESSGQIQAGN